LQFAQKLMIEINNLYGKTELRNGYTLQALACTRVNCNLCCNRQDLVGTKVASWLLCFSLNSSDIMSKITGGVCRSAFYSHPGEL
jgi:hypothetical protein